jgi:signal transduction histidine kinase
MDKGGRGGFGPGRNFRRGAFMVFGFVVLLVAALATLVASALAGNPPDLWVAMVVAAAVLAGLMASVRWVWRNARAVGALMDATDRVAGGDYTVRVEPGSSRHMRRLGVGFNEMTGRLETNESRRRELFADIAHELRTPLQVIRGSVEGMLDGLYPADPERLKGLLDETVVMARLLDDLRTLSMADEGVLPLHVESVDPVGLAEDAARSFERAAHEKGISLVAEGDRSPATVGVDPVRIGEVLSNLLSNAVRHTPTGGSIHVRVTASDHGDALFEVTDTGPGIPADQLSRVFDRFVRSADTGGTGLGLAIAKKLVEAHGGAIEAISPQEGGTRITFTIPSAALRTDDSG